MKTSHIDPLLSGLVSIGDLPGRLGLSKQGFYNLARQPEFPARIKIGRRVFVSEEAVRRWILSRVEGKAA